MLTLGKDKKFLGVCSGFSEFLGIDATVLRIIVVILTIFGGGGLLVYLIAWAVMPKYVGK